MSIPIRPGACDYLYDWRVETWRNSPRTRATAGQVAVNPNSSDEDREIARLHTSAWTCRIRDNYGTGLVTWGRGSAERIAIERAATRMLRERGR